MLKIFLLVGLGSFFGGGARFLVQQYFAKFYITSFPIGTLVVNILGCFLIGIIFSLSEKTTLISSEMRLLLATGFCGGFTTFSSFSLDSLSLLKAGQIFYLVGYVGASVILGFLATYAAIQIIKLL